MSGSKKTLLISAFVLFVILGVTMQKVFSLSMIHLDSPSQTLLLETHLLLSDSSGILPEPESRKVIRQLQSFVADIHTVKRNEWMEKLAAEYGVPGAYFRSTNNLEDPVVRTNQQVIVQNKKGMVHIAKSGELLEAVISAYEKLGSKREKILAMNSLDETTFVKDGVLYLREGVKLWIPDARRSFPIFFHPVVWSRISSRFGVRKHPILKTKRRHDGFDMVAPYGAPVYASESGVITKAGWEGGYGNLIEIRHSNTTTRYGHLSKILVEVGQRVKRKQMVGRVGSTGLSTGAHLHFEVRRNSDGKVQNPRKYLY